MASRAKAAPSALPTQDDTTLPPQLAEDDQLNAAAPQKSTAEDGDAGAVSSIGQANGEEKSLVEWLDISLIQPNPYQPRRTFSPEELDDLAASVREHGVLQPILVRPKEKSPGDDGDVRPGYQLVAGERRWRAAQAAGLSVIPAIVRRVADQQALELALIENVQRHDITPLDAALAYRRLAQEFSLSQEAIARRVGKSRVAVTNTMRLLDLPTEAQKAIEDGVLSEGHGRAILLANGDGARRAVLRRVLREKLSVRATEELARQTLDALSDKAEGEGQASATPPGKFTKNAVALRSIEEKLQKQLKTRVRLKPRAKGGQVVIEYFSTEDLERLISALMQSPTA